MEKVPHKLEIVRANRHMVDHVDHLIAYAWESAENRNKKFPIFSKFCLHKSLYVL